MAGWLCLLLVIIPPAAAAGLLPACPSDAVRGRTRFTDPNCAWNTPQLPPQPSSLQLLGTLSGGVFPAITVGASNSSAAAEQAVPGFTLTIKRLLLRDVTLAAATDTSTPTFAPLGLFSGVPEELSMMDVRLAVNSKDFQDYLAFFSKHLRAIRTKDDGGVGMHTDGTSFLNVPYWSDNHTELYSVTILTGPCNPAVGHVAFSGVQTNLPGCNIRTVNNETLVPTLQRDATINTTQPLLVRITSNVTLGPGLEGPIVVQRPVLLLGTSSAPISVDMGMMVNHLHVLAPTAQLAWQALVLENLAPGDAMSATMAPPYSTTVTTNLWAVYCNRSQDMCVPLTNVTLVIPSQEEIDYLEFMATMYNSPSQALRSLASFYNTDLRMTKFEFLPGTNNMTVLHLVANSWHFWYLVLTTKPMFAPPRPVPRQLFDQLRYKTGVLVQSIKGCASFQATQAFAANRVHVWQLMANVSIGGDVCSLPGINITGPTTLVGEVASTSNTPMSMRSYPLSAAVPGGTGLFTNSSVQNVTDSHTSQVAAVTAQLSGTTMYTLSFHYTPDLFQIPPEAPERYLQVRNITLRHLPQLKGPSNSSNDSSSTRRLLQAGGVAALPFSTDPGVWTIMLWPFNRSMSGAPLLVADCTLFLPHPEWDALANAAKASRHFAILLQGSSELLFAGVTAMEGDVLRVVSFKGPGIEGSNLDLLPDADEAAAIPGYIWPASAAAPPQDASSLRTGLPVAAQAALGAVLGALGLMAAGVAVLLVWRHHRRRQQSQRRAAVAPGKSAAVAPPKSAALAAAQDAADSAAAPDQGRHATKVQASPAATAADGEPSKQRDPLAAVISNSSQHALPASSLSEPLPAFQVSSLDATQASTASSLPPSADISSKPCAAPTPSSDTTKVAEQSIAQGLRHWHDAVSLQTMRLMQQRQEANRSYHRQLTPSTSASSSTLQLPYTAGQEEDTGHVGSVAAAAAAGGSSVVSSSRSSEELQLFKVIGTGSFGVVHLGSWRGKKVAVKVMQLSAHAFSSPPTPATLQQQREGGQQQQQQPAPSGHRHNSRPHMAIMEAVLSTNLHHPNLVHVFTYMLHPLTAQAGGSSNSHQQEALAGPAAASKQPGHVSGWELQLVMEMCEKGTLREALDYGSLPYSPPTKLLHPAIVASLAHDVAAAMLHLHSEGIVHGDLKAGNVLLQANTDVSSAAPGGFGQDVLEVWMAAGCVPLTGKVAGHPTHIPPEGFTSGHVSKASDVYAYGILLYEVLTGHRAYAGVPVPLLPHEVAVQGLRPTWPPGMPAAYSALRALAEACWEHQPQHRPTFQAVLITLEAIQSQQRPGAAASPADVPAYGTYRAPAAAAAVVEGA